MNNLSQEIKRRRLERGLKQHELAYLAGVPQAGISRIEAGASPSVDTLTRLAVVLGTFAVPTVYDWITDTCPESTRVVIVRIGDEQRRAVYMDIQQRFVIGERTYRLEQIDAWRDQ